MFSASEGAQRFKYSHAGNKKRQLNVTKKPIPSAINSRPKALLPLKLVKVLPCKKDKIIATHEEKSITCVIVNIGLPNV